MSVYSLVLYKSLVTKQDLIKLSLKIKFNLIACLTYILIGSNNGRNDRIYVCVACYQSTFRPNN